MKRKKHLIVFVPGFFGFKHLGRIAYFSALKQPLVKRLSEKHKVTAKTFVAKPMPTGAFKVRAQNLLDQSYDEFIHGKYDKIHYIGHSTGGVDIRLALDEKFELESSRAHILANSLMRKTLREHLGARVSIAAPHRGTPLATPFITMGFSVLPSAASPFFSAIGNVIKQEEAVRRIMKIRLPVDEFRKLNRSMEVSGLTPNDLGSIVKFVTSIAVDRRAILGLTPEHMASLNKIQENMGADDRNCFSIITRAPKPDPEAIIHSREKAIEAPTALMYLVLWTVTARFPSNRNFRQIPPSALKKLGVPENEKPDRHDNDGIVPTLSQPWGKIIALVQADHLDVIGHPEWMNSGACFHENEMSKMLDELAECIASSC